MSESFIVMNEPNMRVFEMKFGVMLTGGTDALPKNKLWPPDTVTGNTQLLELFTDGPANMLIIPFWPD
jgi:hypothetical protein